MESNHSSNKIVYTEGCVCTGLDINGKDPEDIGKEEMENIISGFLPSLRKGTLQDILILIAEAEGSCEYDNEPCECCGDIIVTYTYNG